MKSIVLLLLMALPARLMQTAEPVFTGKIVFTNTFKDLDGNDITEQMAPYIGREVHYFINAANYRAYDENDNWVQLDNLKTNTYYSFSKEKRATKIDASKTSSTKFEVTKLAEKVKIAGYECDAMQVETDDMTTVFYYTSKVRVDPAVFATHGYGNWNQFLVATDGALTLKFETTLHKQKLKWISTAKSVKRMKLDDSAFEYPTGVPLKN